MIRLSMQFFAHKKGVGSTKNGRDSESKRLGVKYFGSAARHPHPPRGERWPRIG